MTSLSEAIAEITNPAPKIQDPEDDVNIESTAKLSAKYEEGVDLIQEVSKLRSRNAPLLEDIDPRYAGKRITRKSMEFFEDSRSDLEENETASNDSEDNSEHKDDDSDIEKFKTEFKMLSASHSTGLEEVDSRSDNDDDTIDLAEKYSEDDRESDDINETAESDDTEESSENGNQEGMDMIQNFSHMNVENEIAKGKAVASQQELWNRLCEGRIQMQKLVMTANRTPQYYVWADFKKYSDKEYYDSLTKSYKGVKKVLNCLLKLQETLLDKSPEISNFHTKTSKGDESDVEAAGTSDELNASTNSQQIGGNKMRKKMKFNDYEKLLNERHQTLIPYRNSVISHWDEKTRLSSGKMTQKSFNAFDQSAVKQIEQILQDKQRLIKRTQLKRSAYHVLGKPDKDNSSELPVDEAASEPSPKIQLNDHLKDYDPEIFDDDDFYRQLLKDIIESKTVGVDRIALSKQMEFHRERTKLKKKVDTKASKGRKIRYVPLGKKFENFVPTMALTTGMTEEARSELFKSLFGRQAVVQSM